MSSELPRASRSFSWLSFAQLALSLLGFILLFLFSAFFVMVGASQFFSDGPGLTDLTSTFFNAVSLGFTGLLLLPSAWASFLRLRGKRDRRTGQPVWTGWLYWASILLLTVFPLALFAGNWFSSQENIAWLGLPVLHIVAVSIPIFWLLAVGLRGLSTHSAQRAWGVFGAGLSLGPALILMLEVALLGVFMGIAALYISTMPELAEEISDLFRQLPYIQPSPDRLLEVLQPYITHPAVIASAFVYIALLVPLIEELIKPIGVWFLLGRKPTPADGFIAGLLSGAGYALFENLFLSTSDAQWMGLVLARVGTGAVHMFTASLVGWALVSAWTQGRYLRLVFSLAGAILIHGLWNGMTLLSAGFGWFAGDEMSQLAQAAKYIPLALGALALGCAVMIWIFNRKVKRAIIASLPEAVLPKAAETPELDNETEDI